MKLKLVQMTGAFTAYNNGEESNADLASELITICNAVTTADTKKEHSYNDILIAMFDKFIDAVLDGTLIRSNVHEKTEGINYPRICEALLHVGFELKDVIKAAKAAHENAFGEKLNPGVFGRVGKAPSKPKPSFAKVKSAIERQTKTAASLTGSKDKAEALAAAKLLVAALSV